MTDVALWLRMYARQFEDQHAPQNLTIGMREAAAEIERLRRTNRAEREHRDMLLAEVVRLREAVGRMRELNAEDDGWAHSDLIEQECVAALTPPSDQQEEA